MQDYILFITNKHIFHLECWQHLEQWTHHSSVWDWNRKLVSIWLRGGCVQLLASNLIFIQVLANLNFSLVIFLRSNLAMLENKGSSINHVWARMGGEGSENITRGEVGYSETSRVFVECAIFKLESGAWPWLAVSR